MAVYFIQGHLGSGKSIQAVGRLKAYAQQKRRIAGNIDLDLVNLYESKKSKGTYIRIPDVPTVEDLKMIGLGSDSRAEDKFGALVLDEGAVLFNARDWNQKGRREIVNWFVHARKLRWDVFIIIQDVEALDSQIYRLLCEYTVNCYRLDRVKIPIIGFLFSVIGLKNRMPKIFLASVKYGRGHGRVQADKWTTTGRSVFKCYDTEQATTDEYQHGVFCQLPPWHLVGRYLPKKRTPYQLLSNAFFLSIYYIGKIVLKENVFDDRNSHKPLYARNSARCHAARSQASLGHGRKNANPVPV